jgi:hypothetical protein
VCMFVCFVCVGVSEEERDKEKDALGYLEHCVCIWVFLNFSFGCAL